ncbi:MAG: hypothetical protein ACETVZ_06830, partial [Phycisphaerae bacterium]
AVCENALLVLKGKAPRKFPSKRKTRAGQPASRKAGKFEIRQVPAKGRRRVIMQKVDRRKK